MDKAQTEKKFVSQAKLITDKLFLSGFLRNGISRDDMNRIEDYIEASMSLQLQSEMLYLKMLENDKPVSEFD